MVYQERGPKLGPGMIVIDFNGGDAMEIYRTLRSEGALSAPDIVSRTGLEPTAVNRVLMQLMDEGELRSVEGGRYGHIDFGIGRGKDPGRTDFRPGAYLFTSTEKPEQAYRMWAVMVECGIPGLAITMMPAHEVRKLYGLEGHAEFVQLSLRSEHFAKKPEYCISDSPTDPLKQIRVIEQDVLRLLRTSREFIEARHPAAVLLDGMEWLRHRCGKDTDAVHRLLLDLGETAAVYDSVLFNVVDPEAIDRTDFARLRHHFAIIKEAPGTSSRLLTHGEAARH